jgi:tRNA(fMet)-specific endonuclease VapC
MILLDNDVLVKWGGANPDPQVVSHLQRYSHEEWTIPSIVAFEFYKRCTSRSQMKRTQSKLQRQLDRIINFSDDTALEAAYLGDKLP